MPTIDSYDATTSLADSDVLLASVGGVTKKVAVSTLRDVSQKKTPTTMATGTLDSDYNGKIVINSAAANYTIASTLQDVEVICNNAGGITITASGSEQFRCGIDITDAGTNLTTTTVGTHFRLLKIATNLWFVVKFSGNLVPFDVE